MRIISKEHDYYDVVQKQGTDKSLLYLRNCSKVEGKNRSAFQKVIHPITSNLKSVYRIEHFVREFGTTNIGFVLFCNKVYPYIEFKVTERTGKFSYVNEEVVCYNMKSVEKLMEKYDDGSSGVSTMMTKAKELFSNSGKELKGLIELHFEYKCPVFLVVYNGFRDSVIINPSLKKAEFFKVFEAYSAYQELSMFIGGVLTTSAPKTVEISNEMKAAKHGFDKYSFKNPPKKGK